MTQTRVETMAFNIRFVDDVQTVFITEVIEAMIIRIMRGANRIHIGSLHCDDVLAHVLNRNCFALIGMVIMAVDSHDRDSPTIHTD